MRAPSVEEWGEILKADEYTESRVDYCERKKKEGFEILAPEGGELQIDIDSMEAFKVFKARMSRLVAEFGNFNVRIKESSSGFPHCHVIVDFDLIDVTVTPSERIALQAVLGSDPMREMLSMIRYLRGDPCPSLLAMKDALNNWMTVGEWEASNAKAKGGQ